ncbi:MAG: PQQ-binding-like beta-propeller repeat protein, partial [Planctomycetota bacterium]
MVHVRRLAVHAFFPSLVCILSSALAADLGGLTKEGKLAPEWVPSLGAKSIGSITTVCFPGGASDAQALPDSVLLQAEPRMHALVRRNNDLRGTDVNPLYAAVLLRTQPGSEGPTVPGMYLYWDNYDYLSIRGTGEGHVYCHAVVRGAVVREYSFWNVMRELPSGDWRKWRESWFRIQLVSRNAVFYMSSDGLNWHKLGEAGCRPGEPGKEPRMIILGRGWPGEGQTGRPEMCNDYYPDGNKQLSKTFFTRFSITDNVPIVGEIPAFDKKETWEKTLAALEADGIPRSWSFLGPISSKDIPIRKLLGPDLSDDWTTPQKDAGGNPLKSASWTVPGGEPHAGEAAQDAKEEEALDGYVDLAEHVGQAAQSLAWAKAEVNWPARGNALLWFGSSDIISLYVNNQLVHADADEWNDRRAFKDRFCVPVALNKGRNTLKVRCRQARGEWGFYLRLERNDPAYRARLLEKLLEAFPETAAAAPAPAENWRAAQARHEIVRCYQSLGDYRGALSACDKALAAFAHDDENRLQAFETKLHLLEFLRDADNLVKAGEEYLAAHSGTAGAASAMRAALRGDALAGRAEAAQNRAKRFCAGLADSAVIERTYRDLAVAFKEAGDNEHHLWTLDSLADQAGVEPLARAQAAIESAVSRWALERQRVALQPAQPLDPGKMSLACRSAAKALEILPGAKNPMAAALARDAEADLKAAKPEQAMAGYWGALLLALCASNHEAAPYLSFSKAFKIAVPQKDKDGKPLEDPNLFRKVLWKAVAAALGDPAWTGKWRFVGFTLEPTANLRTPLEPERDPGKSDYGQGRRWQELDLEPDPFPDVYRGNCDLGIDLKKWSGTAQVGYVARDFEVSAAAPGENTTTLRLGACGSWFAWVDGQPVGENTNVAGFRFEESRVQLNLYPGKHRLLLKLEAPPEGPFAFRARLSHEPELAAHLLVQALTVRQFPRTIADRRQDLQWLLGFMQAAGFLTKGSGNEVPYLLANIISQLYADTPAGRLEPLGWACERMRDAADSAQTVAAMQKLIALLETIPWYADRDRQVSDLYLRLALALVSEGRPAEADGVLRDFCAHYSHVRDFYFQALTLRGSLRRDFGQNLGALPFFECVMREYPFAWKTLKPAAWGLEWARTYRPERLIFDTSHEAQAVLDAIRRQLGAGGAEDIERAMRNIGELLASAPGSLSKVVDSPYYTRFVGMREYIRALLASLPEGARDVYRKAVAQPSSLRLKTATHLNDVAALEALANEYYYTPAADAARNRAGNLYLDRGQYAQAASMFQALLKQPAAAEKPRVAHLYAKLARALIADGQPAAAEAAIERLRAECAAASLVIGGETMTGMRLAEKLKIELAHSKTAGPAGTPALPEKAEPGGRVEAAKGDAARSAATHLSNLGRTGAFLGPAPVPGAVVWARPLIPQVAMMAARGPFELVARSHVPSFPVAAEDKVFITGLESARALDLVSGKVLWTRTWGSGGPLLKGSYNGYPLSCPTVRAGRLYMRALESGVSSIRCYAAENGRLRWSTSAAPELRKLTWIGDPAAAYNLVFAVYLEPGDLNTHGVAAMDEDSGRLRWKTNLVTGATGIKVADQYWMSTLHLGPPAVEGGELYVASGLASVASLNAFSGEVKWITTYPRLQFADPQHGFSSAGYDLRLTSCKTFARGPLSPMLAGDLVLVAPKDGCGLLAFERQGGAVRWQLELADCRYLAGIADGNALLCDDGVTAVNLANGRAVWEYRLQDDFLYGQPTLSGGLIYLPARKQLQRVDARTGRLVGASAWDPRLGPLANFAVVGGAGATPCLVGVGENVIGALGAPDAKPVALPLYEARDLEAAGKFEAAAAAYEKLLSSKDTGEVLHALTARIRLLEKLGKHEAALAALEQFERDAPEMLSSFNGLWQVRKDVLAQALRARLGQPAPPDNATPASAGELGALLTFSAFLPGENCALHDPSDKPRENCFVCTGGDILCMSLGTGPGMLWRNYAGPGVGRVLASSRLLAAVADSRITVFDRATGETLCELSVPAATTSARQLLETKRFEEVALGDNALVAATDAGLYAWELPRGKMIWWKQLFYTTRMVPGGLAVSGERVFTVQGAKDQKVNTAFLEAFDLKTGNEMQSLPLCPRCASMLAKFSPDAQLVLYRADRAVVCASTAQMKMLWKADLPKLDTRRDLFAFQDDYIRYHGVENGKWNLLWLNPADGKELRPRTQGFGIRMNGEYVVFSGDWNRTITRQRAQVDKVEKVWEISLPEPAFRDHYLLSAISGPERLHLLYVRCRNNQDQFLCRAFSWETGQLLNEQTLPGTPIRLEDNSFGVSFVQRGNTLVYTAREGVFIYSGVDQPPAKQVEQLRAELAKPELPAARRRSLHSAWVDLEPPELMAFLAPEDVQIDGDLSEWQSTEPIRLQGPLHYVPLAGHSSALGQNGAGGGWTGEEDLSARLYVGWNREGLALAVDVTDDVLCEPQPGMELTSGDCLRVVVDGRAEAGSALDRGESFVGTLAWVQGRSVLDRELSGTAE